MTIKAPIISRKYSYPDQLDQHLLLRKGARTIDKWSTSLQDSANHSGFPEMDLVSWTMRFPNTVRRKSSYLHHTLCTLDLVSVTL